MEWKWTPKPSAELCRLLGALKLGRRQRPLGSMEERVADLEKRFLKRLIAKDNGCIEWDWISLSGPGYGQASIGRKQLGAHRLSYMLYHGKKLGALYVCHACDNRACVNPAHLFAGTAEDNAQDYIKKHGGFHRRRSRLKPPDVIEIRRAYEQSSTPEQMVELARKYNVSRSTIRSVVRGLSWRLIKD